MVDARGTELADRVRALLGEEPGLEEKSMFGSRAFLLHGRILVGARKGGLLLVHVSDEQAAVLVLRPGAARAVMGSRTMKSGWLDVASDALADDDELMFWLDVAREDNSGR
ncbi:TfoX/Sxy family protein [Microbacterium sp. A84]|uniref:TfoX/Sxy family protein n=1 Tax=Microbacterium sp. A84 TaxID=3450715 RepID=UPI003F42DE2A